MVALWRRMPGKQISRKKVSRQAHAGNRKKPVGLEGSENTGVMGQTCGTTRTTLTWHGPERKIGRN